MWTFDERGSNDGAAIDAIGDVMLFGILGGSGGGCDDDGDVIDEGRKHWRYYPFYVQISPNDLVVLVVVILFALKLYVVVVVDEEEESAV